VDEIFGIISFLVLSVLFVWERIFMGAALKNSYVKEKFAYKFFEAKNLMSPFLNPKSAFRVLRGLKNFISIFASIHTPRFPDLGSEKRWK
jgi:hypothetical protein